MLCKGVKQNKKCKQRNNENEKAALGHRAPQQKCCEKGATDLKLLLILKWFNKLKFPKLQNRLQSMVRKQQQKNTLKAAQFWLT